MAISPTSLLNFVPWLNSPLATAAVLYIAGIICVLVFSYFVTLEWF